MTTATDANRYVIRWARAITNRKVLLVFDGCYHGTVDDVMVRHQEGRTVHRGGLIARRTTWPRPAGPCPQRPGGAGGGTGEG